MAEDLDAVAEAMDGITHDLQEHSRQVLADAESLAWDVARLTLRGYKAMQLWAEWFQRYGDPWFEACGDLWCIFCDGQDQHHKRGCIFVRAQKLLEVE